MGTFNDPCMWGSIKKGNPQAGCGVAGWFRREVFHQWMRTRDSFISGNLQMLIDFHGTSELTGT